MANNPLYYVQSDTLPQIKLELTDETDGSAKNLTNKKVYIHVKPATGSGVSFTREATIKSTADRLAGIAFVGWSEGDLVRPAGEYSAEIEIIDIVDGSRETVYELLKIIIREDIGDASPPVPQPTTPTPANTNPL